MKTVYQKAQHSGRGWVRSSPDLRCPICHKPDWCSITDDGLGVVCMRIDVCGQCKVCINGPHTTENGGFWHVLETPAFESSTHDSFKNSGIALAHIQTRDAIYRDILTNLFPLSPEHRKHLLEWRRIPEHILNFYPFGSTREVTPQDTRIAVETYKKKLMGVPGFYIEDGQWHLNVPHPGIAIPVCDHLGRVQAIQVRLDTPDKNGKYKWISSGKYRFGTSIPTIAAIWNGTAFLANDRVFITEGPLKAASAAFTLDECFLGLSSIHGIDSAINNIPPHAEVIVAYDREDNPYVDRAKQSLIEALHERQFQVWDADWNPEYKGVDDAANAGQSIVLKKL